VDDLAALAVAQGAARENVIINAIGPETFTYRELVQTIGRLIGAPRPVIGVPPTLGYWVGRAVGSLMGDVTITREEIAGLMANLLYVDAPPAGATKLTDWIAAHADTLGRHYANELARRRDRRAAYRQDCPENNPNRIRGEGAYRRQVALRRPESVFAANASPQGDARRHAP